MSGESRVDVAVETAVAAEAAESVAVAEAAEAVTQEKTSEAALAAVAAAETAAALATEHAAIAQADAAATINENKGELEWLRMHATQMESFSQNQTREMNTLHQRTRKMETALENLAAGLLLLTPKPLTEEPLKTVDPEKKSKSADAGARKETQSQTKAKPKRTWI